MDIRSMKAVSLAVVLGVAGISSTQVSASDEGRFYITPGAQFTDFDRKRSTGLEDGWFLGFGYGLTENLSTELNYTRMSLSDANDRLRSYRLDALYHIDGKVLGVMDPFVVGGLGHNEFRDDQETALNVGAGAQWRFNDRVAWRTAGRVFHGLDDSTLDFGVDTGLVFYFGDAPAPRVEPTPEPVAVADSDGDGVPDDRDACPNTPRNYAVDERGCPIMIEETARIELAVQFEFDEAVVSQEYMADIGRVAEFLNENDGVVATLEGHTCNMGPDEYNQGLSERRANAVRQVLIDRYNISPSRVTAVGYGEGRPVADNSSREGREQNRRVESVISTTVERPQLRN